MCLIGIGARLTLFVLLLLTAITPAVAEPTIDDCDGKTAVECLNTLIGHLIDQLENKVTGTIATTSTGSSGDDFRAEISRIEMDVRQETADARNKALRRKNTGIDSAGARTSGTKDFLARFAAVAGVAGLDEDDRSMTLDWSKIFGNKNSALQAKTILRDPLLYEPLRQALPDGMRSEIADELSRTLDDLDDVEFVVSWSSVTKSLGRTHKVHDDQWNNLQSAIVMRAVNTVTTRSADLRTFLGGGPGYPGGMSGGIADVQFGTNISQDKKNFRILKEAAEKGIATLFRDSLNQEADKANIQRFADLVNNKPQLDVSASFRERDDLVGPDSWGIKVTYEHGWANTKLLRKRTERRSGPDASLRAFESLLHGSPDGGRDGDEDSQDKAMRRGGRLGFMAEYTDIDDYDVELTDPVLSFQLPADRTLKAGLKFSTYLDGEDAESGQARIDIASAYIDNGDDPARKDRLTASATYSYLVTDDWVFAVGLSYANKEEFQDDDIDREVSANLGLKYRFVPESEW